MRWNLLVDQSLFNMKSGRRPNGSILTLNIKELSIMPGPDFLPYSLQVLQPLKELFLQDRFDDIPGFTIKTDSDFNLISSRMTSLAVTSTALDSHKDQVANSFDTLSEFIQDGTNLTRIQPLEYASKNFAAILENSYNTFHNDITPMVNTLKERIESRYTELMKRENAGELIGSDTELSESDYSFIVWDNLSSPLKQGEIIESACLDAGISSPALSTANLGYVVQKMVRSAEFTDVKTTELEPVLEKMISSLVNANVSEEQVRTYWNAVTSTTSYTNFSMLHRSNFVNTRDNAVNAISTIQLTNAFLSIGQMMPNMLAGVNSDTATAISSNVGVLNKTIYAMQYWLLVCKELRFKGKLIMSRNVINRESFEEFVSNGGSISDINNYIKAFHLDSRPMPVDGISSVIVKSADVADRLLKASSKLKYNETFLKSKCLIAAYSLVMQQFCKETTTASGFTGNPEFFKQRFMYVADARVNTLAGDIANLDKALYDIVVRVFHSDSLVSVLYKYLGNNFDDLTSAATEDITEVDIIKAQCDATAEMLTDYLFKMLVV